MDDAITYLRLGPADLGLLLDVPEDLFDNPVDPLQAQAFLDRPGHVLYLALDGREAVGFASGAVLLHPDKPPALFVNEVGVREAWQRQGIGRGLLTRLFDHGRALGCKGIWLGTEPGNEAALALYRSLGGNEVAFVGFGWDGGL